MGMTDGIVQISNYLPVIGLICLLFVIIGILFGIIGMIVKKES